MSGMLIDQPALVLNSAWQPIGFQPIGTCIATMLRGMGCAIHPETFEPLPFDEWMERAPEGQRMIPTANRDVPAPDVIVLTKYKQVPPMKIGFNRQNLFKRDESSCQYCGVNLPGHKLQVEHVFPRSRGGPTTWTNTVAACNDCNSAKADRTPREAGMTLRKKPQPPHWKPGIKVPQSDMRPLWSQFLRQGA